MTYLNVILTLLTIVTGILTILAFVNNRNKDSASKGKNDGAIKQKVNDIDRRTEEIQRDVRELRNQESLTAKLVVAVQESTRSAHKRIDGLEARFNKQCGEKNYGESRH